MTANPQVAHNARHRLAFSRTSAMLPTPGFHHIHLNSPDPEAAIDWYVHQFPSTSKGKWGGHPALKSPNNVMVLFSRTDKPAPTQPQSAIWHFGWHVVDARASLETYKSRPEVKLLPLYTTDEGGSVLISSDTWPNIGNAIGLTKAQIAEARAKGVQPKGGGGFAYMEGPDHALVEIAGNYPAERFNHVHLWHEDPICALLWYQKHLNAPVRAGFEATQLTEANCKVPRGADRTWPALNREGMFRSPRAGVEFGDVVLTWYPNQGEEPLASSLGQLQDHIGLSVSDLDAWVAKLRGEGVTILDGPYRLGDVRAVMIEGPSREAIELVEVA
jgi:catechol 2,3-dioxygenase-like lactoylglutathione lyase family enzyme